MHMGLRESGYMCVMRNVCNSYSMVTMVNRIVHLQVAKGVKPTYSHHYNNMVIMWGERCAH